MTLKKFNEQTVIIETPSGTDTYTHEASTTYEVVADVADVTGASVVFSASDWNGGNSVVTFTWTCPEDGLYQLTALANRISNSIRIKVDDTTVVDNYAARNEPNRGKETNIVETARVMYTGQRVVFRYYNVEHSRYYTARVKKLDTTNLKFGSNNSDNTIVHKNWPVKAPYFTTNQQ